MKTERFSHKLAIAPTASISIIAGGTSAGIEPVPANIYTAKTLTGTKSIRNRHLQRLLASLGKDTTTVWDSILEHEGSVQHLDFLDDHQKAVFRTAFEIDQRWIIEHAADREPLICQAQSVNLFLPGDVEKWDLHMLHFTAWEKGLKSLYYLRSKSVQRAAHAGAVPRAAHAGIACRAAHARTAWTPWENARHSSRSSACAVAPAAVSSYRRRRRPDRSAQ